MDGYQHPKEYLFNELKRLDLILLYHVQKNRRERCAQKTDQFRGLYISEEEIDSIFGQPGGSCSTEASDAEQADMGRIQDAILDKEKEIENRKEKARREGVTFPLDHLSRIFKLNEFERQVLLLTLAPEIHLKYERIYAYLQDNVSKKRPTVDLLLTLLCQSVEEKILQRSRFCHNAPLRSNNLLQLFDEPGTTHTPLLAKWVKVDEGIVDFLHGENHLDARLRSFFNLVHPNILIQALPLDQLILKRLSSLGDVILNRDRQEPVGFVLYFKGPYGSGKRRAAEALAQKTGLNLMEIDMRPLIASDLDPTFTMDLILREAKLKGVAIYWAHADELFSREERARSWNYVVFKKIRSFPGVAIFGGLPRREAEFFVEALPVIRIEFPPLSHEMRKYLWQKHLGSSGCKLEPAELATIATRFRLTDGQIQDVVSTAKADTIDGRGNNSFSMSHLLKSCRSYTRHKLINLAVKVDTRRSWDDIVLPLHQMDILREICTFVKHQPLVLDEWNFGKKLALTKGLNVLFAGPSGTGKTMSAEILAGELGLDLFRIDLANVVSKYIGETEKNLDRIFREAEHSNAILFFDEADALFGKRSEVRDSHDRYANIEISYLLQKMEAYDGIAILATNLRKNLDEAFLRRMHFTVEFPVPEEEDRLKIWKLCFPSVAPLAEDVDFKLLARQFKIPGGNIKNIAVTSAFYAAENGRRINMASLIHATKREFQKMGKLIVESDFHFGAEDRLSSPLVH